MDLKMKKPSITLLCTLLAFKALAVSYPVSIRSTNGMAFNLTVDHINGDGAGLAGVIAARADQITAGITLNGANANWLTNYNKEFNIIVADGDTSDVRALIQTAINTAAAAGGGVVNLPRGTFRLGDELWASNNVALRGSAFGSTTITFLDSVGAAKRLLQIQAITNFVCEGITFDQNFRNRGLPYNVSLENDCVGLGTTSQNVIFDKCYFYDAGKDGINCDTVNQLKLTSCHFLECGNAGISSQGTNIIIVNCSFKNIGWPLQWSGPHPGAIGDVSGYDEIVADCVFENNFVGILKNGGNNYIFSNNTFYNPTNTSTTNIVITGTSRGVAIGNTMLGGALGYYLTNSAVALDITANYFETRAGCYQASNGAGNQAALIRYVNNHFYNSLISGTSAEKRGIDIAGAFDNQTVIAENDFRCGGTAIYLHSGVNGVLVQNNHSSGSGSSVFVVEANSSSHQIVGNIIPHADATSLNIGASTNMLIEDNICGSDILLTGSSNNIIRFNVCRDINLNSSNTKSNYFALNVVTRNITGTGDYTGQNQWLLPTGATGAAPSYSGVSPVTDKFPNAVAFGSTMKGNGLLLTNVHAGLVISTNSPGTVTGTASETTLYAVTIPAGVLGLNGWMEIHYMATANNDASGKTLKFKIGTTEVTPQANLASGASFTGMKTFLCRNSNTSKISAPSSFTSGVPWAASSLPFLTPSVDTSGAFTFSITGTLSDSADTITLEAVQLRIFYAP